MKKHKKYYIMTKWHKYNRRLNGIVQLSIAQNLNKENLKIIY